jgi:hypothetical protein
MFSNTTSLISDIEEIDSDTEVDSELNQIVFSTTTFADE